MRRDEVQWWQRRTYIKETTGLVVLNQLIELVSVHNDVQTADLREAVLLGLHTCVADLRSI